MAITKKTPSLPNYYLHTGLFSVVLFGLCYGYLRWLGVQGEVNKSLADTAIILMGLSMVLSSVCYFFNFLDWSIVYRKYLGLVGFAFGVAHWIMSWEPFTSLFKVSVWQQGRAWPAFAGSVALGIFSVMALISNMFFAKKLGGKVWRFILRTGYLAVFFVLLHVVLLKFSGWVRWYQNGMQSPPSLSLLVSIFMVIVIVLRIILWWSIRNKVARR